MISKKRKSVKRKKSGHKPNGSNPSSGKIAYELYHSSGTYLEGTTNLNAALEGLLDKRYSVWPELFKQKSLRLIRLSDGAVFVKKSARDKGGWVKKNPRKKSKSASRKAIKQATVKYQDFHGEEPTSVHKMRIGATPKVLYTLGDLHSVTYVADRDGRRNLFVHKFKVKNRPLLTVTKDGRQLYMLGGAYSVTDRGIEDKTR